MVMEWDCNIKFSFTMEKKLINAIDSFVKTLQLGFDVVMLPHLGLIYNKFSCNQHGLKLEDTN
jgi:hypothetical protein